MIFEATNTDIDGILAIWNPVIHDTVATFNSVQKTSDDLRTLLAQKRTKGDAFFVVREEGFVLGFATYGPFRAGLGYRKTAEHTVILAPKAGGRGLGRNLLQAIETHAKARDIHSMIAGISAENTAGINFHLALEYVEVARLEQVGRKFDRWFDLVLMQKFL